MDPLTEKLARRLRRADKGWMAAITSKGYRDEPRENGAPFTEAENVRMFFAEGWRTAFHIYEMSLFRQKDVRQGILEGIVLRDEPTMYKDEP